MKPKLLSELKTKSKARIIRVKGGRIIKRRIMDMGVIPGTELEIERIAPLGDPIEIKVKGYHLSLRKQEASNIEVEEIR